MDVLYDNVWRLISAPTSALLELSFAMNSKTEQFKISVEGHGAVSAVLLWPIKPLACFVFAHGAGAGMNHPFMTSVAEGLAKQDVATLRYQFPYMEKGDKRPDRPEVAHQTVRAAVAAAREKFGRVPIIAGGKSFGGRMTSQTQAISPMQGVVGLVFFGFPLHPAGKPDTGRAEHLDAVNVPILFLQGSRDSLAETSLIERTVKKLGAKASLRMIKGADHSFHVLKSSGRTDQQVLEELLDDFAEWENSINARSRMPS